jgi:membrane protein required for beta-lactamase induction
MENTVKAIMTYLGIAGVLVAWGIAWANQNACIAENLGRIDGLTQRVEYVANQVTESEKAIVRMETKIEYIIKGVDEIKEEVKRK